MLYVLCTYIEHIKLQITHFSQHLSKTGGKSPTATYGPPEITEFITEPQCTPVQLTAHPD